MHLSRRTRAEACMPRPHPDPRFTLIASSFGLGMALLDVTAGNVALPSIRADLHTDAAGLSWVVDGYTLPFASLLLLAGGLGDRLGARRLFTAGLVVFTAASAMCVAAPDIGWLIAARVLQGMGAALFMPASLSILRSAYPEPVERARAIGIWSSLTAVTGASGPLVGGALIHAFGWRSIFLINVPIGVLGVLLALRFVQRSPASATRAFDLGAQAAGAFGLAALTWALIERSARGWSSPLIVLAFVCAAGGIAAFVALERRSADPMLPLHLFRDRTFTTTAAAALVYAAGFFGGLFVLSIEFQDVQGHSPAAAGLLFGIVSVFFGVTSIVAGRLAGRYGTRAPMVGGLAVLCASAVGLAELPASAPLFMEGPLLALTGLGAALVAPSMNAAILASVPSSLAGIGGAVLNTSRQVGTALGIAVFASSFHGRPAAEAVRLSLGCAALLYLCALALASRATAPASQKTYDVIPVVDH
ncbi:MAG: MFS transporter [Deltaproteobacteria bacterium]|nr:MAG: MFS transporter [Deltaproteobacteria bacterium]